MQAKDIPEERIHAIIAQSGRHKTAGEAQIGDFMRELEEFPHKVVHARLKAMVKSGKISADCTCGCSGHYTENDHPVWGSK